MIYNSLRLLLFKKVKRQQKITNRNIKMTTLAKCPQYQTSPYLQNSDGVQQMRKSSKSVSKYIQSSSMLYSPNKKPSQSIKQNTTNNRLNNYQQKDQIHNKSFNNQYDDKIRYPQRNSIGKVVSRLENRLDGAEVKIASLTNIVKLLQKYSETKDDQYQREKQNLTYHKTITQRVQQIDTLQNDHKIKQFSLMAKQIKKELQQVIQLRKKIQTDINSQGQTQLKKFASNKSKKSDMKSPTTSQGQYIDIDDLAITFEQIQGRLRQQINKKVQICLKQIKKMSNNTNQISGIDQKIFEQQISSLNFTINKVENDCLRNKMILEKQIQDLIGKINLKNFQSTKKYSKRSIDHVEDRENSYRDKNHIIDKEKNHIDKNHSRRKSDLSISRDKSKSNLKNSKLNQNKKIKQEQLKQAIRKKKQTKQKLKSKNY